MNIDVSARTARTVLPELHQIILPTPFPVGDVNAYLVEGDPITLIDCGVRTDESRHALEAGLAALGYRLNQIQRLILTHRHTDHVGLAADVVLASRAEVWAHPLAVPWIERPRDARIALRHFTDGLYRESGVPTALIERMAQLGRYLDSLAGPTHVTVTIEEGELLLMAGMRWEVFHTPGHAGDLVCLYQRDKRVLLSSDHLLRDVSSNPLIEVPDQAGQPRPKRLMQYLAEMERIAELPVEVAYTGHGDPILDVRRLVESRCHFHSRRADKIFGLLAGQPRTLFELTELMFPTLRETEWFLALSEVLGHLDMLEHEKRVEWQRRNGLVYWYPIAP